MRWRSAWLTACSVVVAAALGGCGGGTKQAPPPPKLPHALGFRLAQEADAVAKAVNGCVAQARARMLETDLEQSIAQVPVQLRAGLRVRVADLAERFTCVQEEPPADQGRGKGHKKHKKPKQHGGGDD
jgi:hypothetical protein